MNYQQLFSNPKNKYYVVGAVLFALILIAYFIQQIIPQIIPQQKPNTPLIPIITPTDYTKPIVIPTGVFKKQNISFNWGNLSINFPDTIKNYAITEPLIDVISINSLSINLGFTSTDKQRSIKNTTSIWSSSNASLFVSTDQNQIIYQKRTDIPSNSGIISKEEAISIAQTFTTRFFGEKFTQTLSIEPTVRYLNTKLSGYNPVSVSGPESARLVEISFKQNIDSLPVSSLSGSVDILSVVIDTQKDLYRLAIYGGFIQLSEQKSSNILSFEEIKQIAPTEAQKITSIKDVSYEAAFSVTTDISITVESVSLGYFLKEDNTLYPVYYIKGKATGNKLPKIDITYMVPATKI